jgi:hypothetical protein
MEEQPITETILTQHFNTYYDGLMRIESRNQGEYSENPLKNTTSTFIKTKTGFTGTMDLFDGFFTKRYMTFHIKVEETFNKKMNRQIIRCDISKQDFNHPVWEQFKQVTIKKKYR